MIEKVYGGNENIILEKEMETEMAKFEKNALLISLVFLQVLAEISSENKDKAYLLFKAFKLYFVQQEKRNSFEKNRILDKIDFYRDLCKTLVSRNPKIPSLETINNILFAKNVSLENLNNHKQLIENVLFLVKEKTEEVYLLTSEIEILNKELQYWIFDYKNVRHSKELRVIL